MVDTNGSITPAVVGFEEKEHIMIVVKGRAWVSLHLGLLVACPKLSRM